eukprot:COSAG06_NODE_63007_length_263_cov_0.939024_1_plen_66_part_10
MLGACRGTAAWSARPVLSQQRVCQMWPTLIVHAAVDDGVVRYDAATVQSQWSSSWLATGCTTTKPR